MTHLHLERTRTEDDASNNLIIAILLDLSRGKFSNSTRSLTEETVNCDLSLSNKDDKKADLGVAKNILNHARQI